MELNALLNLDTAQLQTWLSEALAARHQLAIGARTVAIQWEDRRQQYSEADVPALNRYIADLQTAITRKTTGGLPARRPIQALL